MKLVFKYCLVVHIRHCVFSRVDGWRTFYSYVRYYLPCVKAHEPPSIFLDTFKGFISKHDFVSLEKSERPYCAYLSCGGHVYFLDLFDRYQLFGRKVKTCGSVCRHLSYSSDYDYVHPRNGFDV